MLLSGAIPPPEWAQSFIKTLEACTGMPGNRRWVEDLSRDGDTGYIFGGTESPRGENGPAGRIKKRPDMGSRNSSYTSYFDFSENTDPHQEWRAGMQTKFNGGTPPTEYPESNSKHKAATFSGRDLDGDEPTTKFFETRFESDFLSHDGKHRKSSGAAEYSFGNTGSDATHKRSVSAYTPQTSSRFLKSRSKSTGNPFEIYGNQHSTYDDYEHHDLDADRDVFGSPIPNAARGLRGSSPPPPPKLTPKAELTRPLQPHEGVARAIALFDFNAVQVSILSVHFHSWFTRFIYSLEIYRSRKGKSLLSRK
jgi:SH3 domain-containing YSC84-like protein 1